jgi:hypothetical protein
MNPKADLLFVSLPYQNILLSHPSKSGIKVIDFGSSCFEHEKGELSFRLSSRCVLGEILELTT